MPGSAQVASSYHERYYVLLLVLVFATGLLLIGFFHPDPSDPALSEHVLNGLGEAAIIATLLALLVDPVVKGRFARELTAATFPDVFAAGMPLPYREKLRDLISKTPVYRKDMEMNVTIGEATEGKRPLDIEVRFDVVNATSKPQKYQQHLEFDAAEEPVLKSVSLWDGGKPVRTYTDESPTLVDDGKGRIQFLHPGYPISSYEAGGRYQFRAHCVLTYPAEFFYVQDFVDSTHNFTLKIKHPADLQVEVATMGVDEVAPSVDDGWKVWTYHDMFFAGTHTFFRWKRAREAGTAASAAAA